MRGSWLLFPDVLRMCPDTATIDEMITTLYAYLFGEKVNEEGSPTLEALREKLKTEYGGDDEFPAFTLGNFRGLEAQMKTALSESTGNPKVTAALTSLFADKDGGPGRQKRRRTDLAAVLSALSEPLDPGFDHWTGESADALKAMLNSDWPEAAKLPMSKSDYDRLIGNAPSLARVVRTVDDEDPDERLTAILYGLGFYACYDSDTPSEDDYHHGHDAAFKALPDLMCLQGHWTVGSIRNNSMKQFTRATVARESARARALVTMQQGRVSHTPLSCPLREPVVARQQHLWHCHASCPSGKRRMQPERAEFQPVTKGVCRRDNLQRKGRTLRTMYPEMCHGFGGSTAPNARETRAQRKRGQSRQASKSPGDQT
eukprot:m.352359 g.352359  ORF g.352359 m.352359 type:complete len:372 (-) comp16583_c0_seq1:185-1300(-)